ncbi:MAG TPA: tRNA (N6-isopentenyl adenosine(37)-C2)-methylthiotransferase MiaB [Patescibacteria group bacterium]|nr:tRNA (N6-isopentenyl adenosine(37)-C2)-methylthiotransferase MiaB [Patescibacteria group bacterium]
MQLKHHYHILTYGCQMNENDSERLAGQLKAAGYEHTEEMAQADVILINTCCVRESAEKKIFGKIGELKRLKAGNPNLVIGIAGCMAQKDQEKLFKRAPHIDIVLGTGNTGELLAAVQKVAQGRERVLAVWEQAQAQSVEVPVLRRGLVSAWTPIMNGCNNFCTYCIVPYVRGRERSRVKADILAEIRQLDREGFKEVTLLGQNVNSYGKDSQENGDFAGLLQAVDDIEGISRVRYMTSHPRDMDDRVIEVVAASRKVCEHFHLPIQSGSDALLEKMNRGYTTDYYRKLVAKIRQELPKASITTDLIVGFPGETETLFQETLAFVREIGFDAAYTFLYSQRSGTPAATMPDQVPLPEKKSRLKLLMDLQNESSLRINRALEGAVLEVLAEGTSKNDENTYMGRTRTNKIVLWKRGGQEAPGQLLNVRIEQGQTWVLKGTRVE